MDKKLFFALPFAALAIASCSNDDELASAPQAVPVANAPVSQAVQFFPVAQNTTRGVLATDASIKADPYGYFYVKADGYFYDMLKHVDNELTNTETGDNLVKRTDLRRYVEYGNNTWSVTPVDNGLTGDGLVKYGRIYWQDDEDPTGTLNPADAANNADAAAYTAKFTAIAGLDAKMSATNPATNAAWTKVNIFDALRTMDPNKVPVTINNIVADQKDVSVAYTEDTQAKLKVNGVPLHFRHALSQILFNGKYAYDETTPTEEEVNFGDIRVSVKECVVVNAKNTGTLKLPITPTTSGLPYDAAWTEWDNIAYAPDAQYYNGSWADYTSKSYSELHYAYNSVLASPVELANEKQNYVIDNSKTTIGPMLLLPQTLDAASEIKSNYMDADDNKTEGAYIMLKVNIQRKLMPKNGANKDDMKWFRWYPANGTGDYQLLNTAGDGYNVESGDDATDIEKLIGGADAPQDLSAFKDDDAAWAYIAVPVKFDWKPGYKYTFILNFSNLAAGWFAPNWFTGASAATDFSKIIPYFSEGTTKATHNDPVIPGVHKPVTFSVTVESVWEDGGEVTPALQ